MIAFLRKPLVLKILSLIAAIIIWIYVINIENPEVEYELKAVNVNVTTKDTIPYKNGLIITQGQSQTIDVKLKGRHNSLSSYDFNTITAAVDINSVTQEGEYTLPINITVPGNDVWLVSSTPNKIKLIFSKTKTLNVPIKVVTDGTLPNNYVIDTTKVEPAFINVTGPTKEVESISHAAVHINVDNLTKDTTKTSNISLITYDNKELKSNNITLDINKVNVGISLLKKKDVPLTVKTIGKYSQNDKSVITYDIKPKIVTILGKPENVDKIETINLGTIDVTNVIDNQQRSFDIIVPNTVKKQSTETSAMVTIKISSSETKTISGVNIGTTLLSSINLDGRNVTLTKKQIDVTVSGIAPDIHNVGVNDLITEADFAKLDLTKETQEIPVIIIVATNKNINIVGQYSVIVEVK